MSRGRLFDLALLLLACAVLSWSSPTFGQAAELVAEESSGTIPLEGETRVVLRGFIGDLRVRAGERKEIRFMSGQLGATSKEVPIAVWMSGGEVRLLPAPGTEEIPRELQVVVDPNLFVTVLEARGAVAASGLTAGLDVEGTVVDVDARGLTGSVRILTLGGRAQVQEIDGDVQLRVRGCAATLSAIRGSVLLNVEDSGLEVRKIRDSVEGELRGTQWRLDDVQQPVLLRSTGGSGAARKLALGGELRLSGTPFLLEDSKGDTDIDTDAEFRFSKTQADLHVNSYGASVFGRENQGLLEVRTDGSSVEVEQNTGPVRVQGQGLRLKLSHVTGELFVDAKSSELEIDNPSGDVTLQTENTGIVLKNASQSVEIESRGGDVEVLDLRGTVQIDADGERVVVSWATLYPGKDCSVKNSGGGIEMRFPANSWARIEAESKFGTVESELEGLEVSESGSAASGALGALANRPLIKLVAERDIVLTGAAAADPEQP